MRVLHYTIDTYVYFPSFRSQTSIKELGYEVKISRDSFGRRVYHTVLNNYKTELKGKGLYVIDSITSQPRLLYLIMKQRGVIDNNYNAIFENEVDFYEYLISELKLAGTKKKTPRRQAKSKFTFWVNGNGNAPYIQIGELFPIATGFIKKVKRQNYKDCAALLHRQEASIWIDDLLENIPVEFALPVHDSLIVKKEDLQTVLRYCKDKYPDLRFDCEKLDNLKPETAE